MKNNFPIKYTSRDYKSIKNDLIEYARRYYSDLGMDLNENSLLSFIIDSVAYTGDILSYHTDFNFNESFINTAVLDENIEKAARQLGYKPKANPSAYGKVAVYVLFPANANGNAPDWSYSFTLQKGASIISSAGNRYITSEDIKINESQKGVDYVVARVNSTTNVPTYYAVKVYIGVVSGAIKTATFPVSDTIKFPKLFLGSLNIAEIIDVIDEDGNKYYQVPSLTQNVVYKTYKYTSTDNTVTRVVKPIYALRRFLYLIENNNVYLQFGGRDINSDPVLTVDTIAEPYKVALEEFGKEYVADTYLEPNKLIDNDVLGLGPQGKTLTITYRENGSLVTSDPERSVNTFTGTDKIVFDNRNSLDTAKVSVMLNSVEVTNEEAIAANFTSLTNDEYKELASSNFITQNRAVTDRDYETLLYTMPPSLGSVKRVKVKRDINSLRNNLNVYVISKDVLNLVKTNDVVKQNIKNWLNNYRIVTDTIDILDAKIINVGINFEIMADTNYDAVEVLNKALEQLKFVYATNLQIGEPFSITNVYRELRKINGILDVTKVEIVSKSGFGYSDIKYDIKGNTSKDGRDILIPENCIFEIKDTTADIIGVVR